MYENGHRRMTDQVLDHHLLVPSFPQAQVQTLSVIKRKEMLHFCLICLNRKDGKRLTKS